MFSTYAKMLPVLILLQAGGIAGAQITVNESSVVRNGQLLKAVKYLCRIGSAKLRYELLCDPETGNAAAEKWEDYFFGLYLGTKFQEGWSIWNFLQVYDARKRNVLKRKPPYIYSYRFSGGEFLHLVWKEVSLRVIQFSGDDKWLYFRLEFRADTPHEISLMAYPGGTDRKVPWRERHLAVESDDFGLTGKPIEIPLPENGLALYNRNYKEDSGNFMVFDSSAAAGLTAGSPGGNVIRLAFLPRKDTRSFSFALGYFSGESGRSAVERFLKEQRPAIHGRLMNVDWSPEADFSTLDGQVRNCGSFLRKFADPETQEEAEVLIRRFQNRRLKKDYPGCLAAWRELEKLQERDAGILLKKLR